MQKLGNTGALLGLGFAPLAAPVIVTMIKGSFDPFSFLITYVIAIGSFFLLGLPALVVLDVQNKLNVLTLCICGAVTGMLVIVLLALANGGTDVEAVAASMLWGAGLGLAVAWTFGVFAGMAKAKD